VLHMMTYFDMLSRSLILLICCHCRSQKFEDPAEGEAALVAKFQKLHEDLTTGFRNLEDETR